MEILPKIIINNDGTKIRIQFVANTIFYCIIDTK